MLPLLEFARDGQDHGTKDALDALARQFSLSDQERAELLPSGVQPIFSNRVGWARTFLKQAGLLDAPRRGVFRITESGRQLLSERPTTIDMKLLERYESYRAFRLRGKGSSTQTAGVDETAKETPEDAMAAAYQRLRSELENELLDQIKSATPAFSRNSSLICCLRWDTVGRGATRGVR